MAYNPEISSAEVTEQPKYYHPELHGQHPEERDYGVDQWYHRKDRLDQHASEELETVLDELHDIPEVQEYAEEPVTFSTIRSMPDVARDFVSPEHESEFAEAATIYLELADELPGYVDRYADTLRRFQSVNLQRHRLDSDKYQSLMRTVDTARRRAHNALMDHLHALSRFMSQRIPKAAGSDFNAIGWQDHLKKNWFSLSQLKDRAYIESWAVRADIGEKALAVESAIKLVLDKKKADVA